MSLYSANKNLNCANISFPIIKKKAETLCGLVGLAHAASAKTAAGKESDLTVCLIVKREELQKYGEVPGIISPNNCSPPQNKLTSQKMGKKKPEKVECVHYTDVKMVNIVIAVKSQLTAHLV